MTTFSLCPQDLTGKVRKTGKYCFANGALADVWLGEWSEETSIKIVAVKVIRDVSSNADHFDLLKKKLLREAKVWNRLNHLNIVPFHGVCFDQGILSAPCLVCPYFKNGNVAKYLEKNPKADRIRLVRQVAIGLAYLHNQGIIHGDMKSFNVLVDDMDNACITDFGLARVLGESGFTTKSVGGTCRWIAYELVKLSEEEEEIPQVTIESDIWAFGMTVLEILTGRLPFFHLKRDVSVIGYIIGGGCPKRDRYPEISGNIWSMLERCWHKEPSQRPSIESIVLYLG